MRNCIKQLFPAKTNKSKFCKTSMNWKHGRTGRQDRFWLGGACNLTRQPTNNRQTNTSHVMKYMYICVWVCVSVCVSTIYIYYTIYTNYSHTSCADGLHKT